MNQHRLPQNESRTEKGNNTTISHIPRSHFWKPFYVLKKSDRCKVFFLYCDSLWIIFGKIPKKLGKVIFFISHYNDDKWHKDKELHITWTYKVIYKMSESVTSQMVSARTCNNVGFDIENVKAHLSICVIFK